MCGWFSDMYLRIVSLCRDWVRKYMTPKNMYVLCILAMFVI